MSERSQRTDLAALAGYAIAACLFFGPILFTSAILTGFDTVTIFYPHRAAAARALLAGQLPLWNPDHFLGAPLLANPQVAVFYPLNWPFFALSAGKSLAWTMALHIVLAAIFMYLFCRKELALRPAAAWLAGAAFAFGGFMGQQTGHLNQVSVAAWLPLVLLLGARLWRRPTLRRLAALGLAIAMQLLAGHSQESYMILGALVVYVLFLSLSEHGLRRLPPLRPLLVIALAVALGGALAAVQLLPTLELSGLSVRSGGLSFRQASSFSLHPRDLALALLPGYSEAAPSEMAGHVGVTGLLLALLGACCHHRRREALFLAVAALAALLLALGRYTPLYWAAYYALPGVSLFRVPARWLFLCTFALAALAGMGLDVLLRDALARRRAAVVGGAGGGLALILALASPWLRFPPAPTVAAWAVVTALVIFIVSLRVPARWPRAGAALLALALLAELYTAGRHFEYNHYAAPETLTALRPAIAYVQTQAAAAEGQPFRVLSVSDATWDPGDLPEIRAMLSGQPASRVADYLDALKNKELLTANLSSLFGLQSADGYDGGVLPLRDYVEMEALFLPADELSPDGRLRDHLDRIPEARLLSLLNVAYIITDKNRDAWLDNVYYDLSFARIITNQASFTVTQPGIATAVGLVARSAPGGVALAQVVVSDARGGEATADIVAGQLAGRPVDVAGDGRYVHAVIPLSAPVAASSVTVRLLPGAAPLALRGLSLIDERTGSSRSVTIGSDMLLVHSGDVKIYRNLANLPRAYSVHQLRVLGAGQSAVSAMRAEDFDPDVEAVVAEPLPELGEGGKKDDIRIVAYARERVVIAARMGSAGLLVLSDAAYPGWRAYVDGVETPIRRANHMLRAVALPEGLHQVEFIYRPRSLAVGAAVSLAALATLTVACAAGRRSQRLRGW